MIPARSKSPTACVIGVGILLIAISASLLIAAHAQAPATPVTRFDEDGTSHVSDLAMSPSAFASAEANAALARGDARGPSAMPPLSDIRALRAFFSARNDEGVARMRQIYPVTIRARRIGGVGTEVIEPVGGPSPENAHRVLINLHGGGFMWGEGSGGEVESIPIASVGRIKVITVAYRLAPEHRFPAASEDVASVYRAL